MAKFFLLSIVIAMTVLPIRAARSADAREGFRKALFHVALYEALYLLGLVYLYGQGGVIHALYMFAIVVLFRYI